LLSRTAAVHLAATLCEGAERMSQLDNTNPVSEHGLYLTLYVSNAGGV
jgi:hypothetical protein